MITDLFKKILFLLLYSPGIFFFFYHLLDVLSRPNQAWFVAQKLLFLIIFPLTIVFVFSKLSLQRFLDPILILSYIAYIILAIVNKSITLVLFLVFLYGGFVWSARLLKENPFSNRKKNLSPEARKKLTYSAFLGFFLIVFFFFLTRFILSELWEKAEEHSLQSGWSSNQGSLGWYDAREKCNSLGMRLPTIEELKSANEAKLTKSWSMFGDEYWSSSPFGTNGHYYLNLKTSEEFFGIPSDQFSTRCLH